MFISNLSHIIAEEKQPGEGTGTSGVFVQES